MSSLYDEIDIPQRILLGAGPSAAHPSVLTELSRPTIGHLDPALFPINDAIKKLLRYVFQSDDSLALPIPGTGTAAMEAAIANLVEPGEKILIGVNGFFGARLAEIAKRYSAKVETVNQEWGLPILPEHIELGLKNNPDTKVVGVVHAETSTGVLSPIQDICEVVHQKNIPIIVDAVTSLGGEKLLTADWDIDFCYGATQKCLGATPGLGPVNLRDRALEKLHSRKTPISTFYLDLLTVHKYWDAERMYHHTSPVNNLFSLLRALELVKEEGIENRWLRHKKNAFALRKGLDVLGIKSFASQEYELNTLISVIIPDNVDDMEFRNQLYEQFNIEISGGLGDVKGKIWRIGLMGYSSRNENIVKLLNALETLLITNGNLKNKVNAAKYAEEALSNF